MTSIPELDKLFSEIGTYRKSSELKELFQFIKRFPRIAPYNAMLLHIQKPGSQYVTSASDWQKRFKRSINPGARPLVILRPFGPVAFVFELGDTYGKDPFPKKLLEPFGVEGEVPSRHFSNLKMKLKCDGISYTEVEHGTASAGFIQVSKLKKEEKISSSKKETWVKTLYDIVINRNHSDTTKFATLVHELGHLYCGHLGVPYEKWWEDRSQLDKNRREFEAESVCWLVCERLGIKNPSAEYLNGYLDNNEEIPNVSIDTVLKSVNMIEAMMDGNKVPRKEIITREIDIK